MMNRFGISKEIMMSAQFNEVVFHITETLGDDAFHQLEEGVRRDSGVVSVGTTRISFT